MSVNRLSLCMCVCLHQRPTGSLTLWIMQTNLHASRKSTNAKRIEKSLKFVLSSFKTVQHSIGNQAIASQMRILFVALAYTYTGSVSFNSWYNICLYIFCFIWRWQSLSFTPSQRALKTNRNKAVNFISFLKKSFLYGHPHKMYFHYITSHYS